MGLGIVLSNVFIENKGANQLHDYYAANSVPLFLHMQKAGFLMTKVISKKGLREVMRLILPQNSSSLLSPQSLTPLHRKPTGTHLLLLHTYSDPLQVDWAVNIQIHSH